MDLPTQRWAGVGDPTLPLVVSFFTPGFYAREAWELMRSCQAVDLAYEIEELPNLGDWLSNVNRKPEFLLRKHAEHPTRSLLWLDADSRVRRVPRLFRGL